MKKIAILSIAGAVAFAVPALADGSSTTTPSAQKQCRTERSNMGRALFAATYGTNADRSNAFGKCVSKRARATQQAEETAHANAAKECSTERAADPAAFKTKYGSNGSGANAFGKCVSQKASSKAKKEISTEVQADVNAAKSCKAERAADKSAFAEKYGTGRNAFGKCVSQTAKARQSDTD